MAGKLPPDKKSKELRYGTTSATASLLGDIEILSANPDHPQDWMRAKVNASGSYEVKEIDEKDNEMSLNLDNGQVRSYVCKSKSSQVDGHIDTNSESTIKQNSAGDSSLSCKTRYTVITEGNVQAVREFCKEFCTSQSESKSFRGTFGDQVCEHSGHWHEAFEKDQVSAITKNKITMIREGDYAIHTQKGNFDLEVTSGKLHLMAKGNDLIANSNVKVLLEVGNQSKVTVQPASIKLQVGAASYIEITAGKITIKSPIIDLNP